MGRIKSILIKLKPVIHRFRILIWIISILMALLAGASAYLRIYGIPGPLLREAVQRANEAGIPVDISSVKLTLRGWRADNVRYFSMNPADTKPIFKADEVYLFKYPFTQPEGSRIWKFNIEALGVELGPSVEWGVEMPEQSPVRNIDSIKLSLAFLPDRIEFSEGTMHWLGSGFSLNGSFVKPTAKTIAARVPESERPKKEKHQTLSPVYVNKEMFQNLEDRLNAIQMEGAATIDISFYVDANDYATSTLKLEAKADTIRIRGVDFSQAAVSANYCYPNVILQHMALYREGKAAQLTGSYDLSTNVVHGTLSNTIASSEPLQLLPTSVHHLLEKLELQFGQLPLFELNVASCTPADALNHISGAFSVDDITFAGSTIQTLEGKLERKNDRLQLSELSGTMLGLEPLSEKTGSGMQGGTVSGSAYFDSQSQWFGVDADLNLDPSLLIGPLSTVRIATNVLHRFKFNGDKPPLGHIELGSCVTNWSSFFIDIQLAGDDVTVHESEFSSVDLTASYSNAVLVLEPLSAFQRTNALTGAVSIDFRQSTAQLDVLTSMQPLTVQNAAYPPLGLFGKSIKTAGKMDIKAKGLIDWKRMQATDFEAEIAAEYIELPIACLSNFTGTVFGVGPLLRVKDTEFMLYGGKGFGDVSITIDPEQEGLPFGVDLVLQKVDLRQCIQFFDSKSDVKVSGKIGGSILLEADLKKSFFGSAQGCSLIAITEGQLADLPFLQDFTKLMRRVLPSFNIFSFTGFSANFHLADGIIRTENASLEGELISAKSHGLYSEKEGFDAYIQVQTFSSRPVSELVRVVTDPILKLFEVKLEGPLSDPVWKFR